MCLFRRPKFSKQAKSCEPSQERAFDSETTLRKAQDDSSFDLSTSYTVSQSELSKESKVSRETINSSGSALSLASLKGMLSDGAHFFTFKELQNATGNFNAAKNLGGGTFCGTISGKKVTVIVDKRTRMDIDFVAEVKSICNLHHSSLIKLIGGCMTGDRLFLVYEYIDGANLRQCLGSTFVPGFTMLKAWTERIRVALEVAKGIEYLHEHASPPFVHKYIKSSSIILDNELHVRIANVGVARIRGETAIELDLASAQEARQLPRNHSLARNEQGPHHGRAFGRPRSIKITGTHGYMAPEYTQIGLITSKLDVYAFGVVLLEILSGQEAVRFQRSPDGNTVNKTVLPVVIAAIFSDKDPRARIREWIDPLLRDNFPLECACKAALVARKCVQANPDDRPAMRNVTLSLQQIYSASKQWEDNMLASKNMLTSTLTAR